MASTITSHDVAVATIAERLAIVTAAKEGLPEGSPLRAFLGDLRFVYQQCAKELDRVESMQAVVENLTLATMGTRLQGKLSFCVASSDALFALTGTAYLGGRHD